MHLLSMLSAIGGVGHGVLASNLLRQGRLPSSSDDLLLMTPGLGVAILLTAMAYIGKRRRDRGQPFWASFRLTFAVLIGYLTGALISVAGGLAV